MCLRSLHQKQIRTTRTSASMKTPSLPQQRTHPRPKVRAVGKEKAKGNPKPNVDAVPMFPETSSASPWRLQMDVGSVGRTTCQLGAPKPHREANAAGASMYAPSQGATSPMACQTIHDYHSLIPDHLHLSKLGCQPNAPVRHRMNFLPLRFLQELVI